MSTILDNENMLDIHLEILSEIVDMRIASEIKDRFSKFHFEYARAFDSQHNRQQRSEA